VEKKDYFLMMLGRSYNESRGWQTGPTSPHLCQLKTANSAQNGKRINIFSVDPKIMMSFAITRKMQYYCQ
jgi:hypothetical protein